MSTTSTKAVRVAASAFVVGAGNTGFGQHEGSDPLSLMADAAHRALADACVPHGAVDGVLCGYATTLPHLMLADLFCERFGLRPPYAHAMSAGGATGGAMLMLAGELVRAGRCRRVLVVAGENRASGVSRDAAIQTLAQVGDPSVEVPNGATIPAYYALLASRWLHETGATEQDLAGFAVLMRAHAAGHPDAHRREPITLADVLASRPIATPLKLLDCCPISDGAVALVVADAPGAGQSAGEPVAILAAGQAHRHQHLGALADIAATGAGESAARAFAQAGLAPADVDYLAVYDSFTITLAMLLEETGFAPRGGAATRLRAGDFAVDGALPLNTHGGLLSFGHSGVAGGLAHAAEAYRQLAGKAGTRQRGERRCAFLHADGGVLSAHVSLLLGRP